MLCVRGRGGRGPGGSVYVCTTYVRGGGGVHFLFYFVVAVRAFFVFCAVPRTAPRRRRPCIMAKFETPESKRLRYVVQASRGATISERLLVLVSSFLKAARLLCSATQPCVCLLLSRCCSAATHQTFLALLWPRPAARVPARALSQFDPHDFYFTCARETAPLSRTLNYPGRCVCPSIRRPRPLDSCCP